MTLNSGDLNIICQKLTKAALSAGDLIKTYHKQDLKVEYKETMKTLSSQVVTEIDIKSQQIIMEQLNPIIKKYDCGVLSEELTDDGSRFEKDYFFSIDPLDGTLPFTESKPGFAVSIALVSKSGFPFIGVVYDPYNQNLYHAVHDQGAFKNQQQWMIKQKKSKTFHVHLNRSFLKHTQYNHIIEEFESLIKNKGYETMQIRSGAGAVMNAVSVLQNPSSCYFNFPKKEQGGGCLWDFSATACLFNEMKAIAVDFKGESLDLNQKDSLFMNNKGIIFCHKHEMVQNMMNLYKKISK